MFNEDMKKFFVQVKKDGPGRPKVREFDNIEDAISSAWGLRAEGDEINMYCTEDSDEKDFAEAQKFADIENDNGDTFWLFNNSFNIGETGLEVTSPEDITRYLRYNKYVGDLDPEDLEAPHGKARRNSENVGFIFDDQGFYTPQMFQTNMMRAETAID